MSNKVEEQLKLLNEILSIVTFGRRGDGSLYISEAKGYVATVKGDVVTVEGNVHTVEGNVHRVKGGVDVMNSWFSPESFGLTGRKHDGILVDDALPSEPTT